MYRAWWDSITLIPKLSSVRRALATVATPKNYNKFIPCSSIVGSLQELGNLQCNYRKTFEKVSMSLQGWGPRVVVSTAALHARVRGSLPGLRGLRETKNVSSPSMCESQYCVEPPWPRGSVLGLRPPGLEFRILCLEDSVILIISPSSGGSPGPV